MHSQSILALLALPLLTSAHFQLIYPPSRGTSDANQASFPCGGYAQTQNRTRVPLSGFPVSLSLGHTENLIEVVLAVGSNPGNGFNTVLYPTVRETGPGSYCLRNLAIPAGLNITDGTNATIQVITNSHDGSGLYNCADITFSLSASASSISCTNQTGVSATFLTGASYFNANESTSSTTQNVSTSSGSAGITATASSARASAASATSTAGAVGVVNAGSGTGWGVLGAAVLGGFAWL